MPDRTLIISMASEYGISMNKARITVNLCYNVSGSYKLKPWFISKHENLRAFGSYGVYAQNLRMIWRYNSSIWMTGRIFDEWLNWFRKEVSNKRCILLIDGFSVYKSGLEIRELKENGPFENIKIMFLSVNAISVC